MTRILDGSLVEQLCGSDPARVLEVLEGAARIGGADAGAGARRIPVELPGPGEAMVLVPGLLPGVDAYTVKVNAKFPAAQPAIGGVVCLHSLVDGGLSALIDSASLTAWRTGLTAALMTDRLSRSGATGLGFVGTGAQARTVLRGLLELRGPQATVACDLDQEAVARFRAEAASLGVAVEDRDTPAAVARDADIVVSATWSRESLLGLADMRPGMHLTTLGVDARGKIEADAGLLTAAKVFVDSSELAVRDGALGSVGLGPEAVEATLREVIVGDHPGRRDDAELTVFAPVGMPWQDLALARFLFREAERHGLGLEVDLVAGRAR